MVDVWCFGVLVFGVWCSLVVGCCSLSVVVRCLLFVVWLLCIVCLVFVVCCCLNRFDDCFMCCLMFGV